MSRDLIIWISGWPIGALAYHHWLGKPMARLLGFEKDTDE